MYMQRLAALYLSACAAQAFKYDGPEYKSLPLDTIFPGPWESNIRAPFNKSYVQPVKIFKLEGPVSGAGTVLQDANSQDSSFEISSGGLVVFEFAENIGGQ